MTTLSSFGVRVGVGRGRGLLAGASDGPGLLAHRVRRGRLRTLSSEHLAALCESVDVHGRGGAGFPFARKLRTAASQRGRPIVVVNLSEGEPASLKDAVLTQTAPHLVLDGAVATAHALGAREVHLALPCANVATARAVRLALAERSLEGADREDDRVDWVLHETQESFVAGQSSAVLELMAGRANLPVTTWQPTAVRGHRRRPTLLSNAETFAHVGLLVLEVSGDGARTSRPATTLLTLDGDAGTALGVSAVSPRVVEVEVGTPWAEVVESHRLEGPVLLGGYHGTWAAPGQLRREVVCRDAMAQRGLSLGAGVVLPLDAGCPVRRTSQIVGYLAGQSARRCGPCFNGLPALAGTLRDLAAGVGVSAEVTRIADLVDGRGACAHPDGTVRLVRSLFTAYTDEVDAHRRGGCGWDDLAQEPA